MREMRRWGIGVVLFVGVVGSAGADWGTVRVYLRGVLADRAGRVAEALEAYQQVLREDPSAGYLNASVAELSLQTGDGDGALVAAQKAVEVSTGNPAGYILLGRVHAARGEGAQAQAAFDQALVVDPGNVEALSLAESQKEVTDPRSIRGLFETFGRLNPNDELTRHRLSLFQNNKDAFLVAEKAFKKSLKDDPSDVVALSGLAGLYDVQGDMATAVAWYEKYLEIVPDNIEVLSRLGQIYFSQKKYDQARTRFLEAEDQTPGDPRLSFWLAVCAEGQKDWPEAVRRMERVAEGSEEPGVLLRLATYYAELDRRSDAVVLLERLQKSRPQNPDFMFYLGLAWSDSGEYGKAIDWLNKALVLSPNNPDIHFQLAMNWDKKKNFHRTEFHLEKTIELNPQHHPALNFLAYSWAERGESLEKALALALRAVALDPANDAYQDTLGWAYFKLGRWAEAELVMGPVSQRVEDPVVWQHQGDILHALGRKDEAVRAWQEALLFNPNGPDLLKRLKPSAGKSSALTPAGIRTLLKRVEGNTRGISSLSGLSTVSLKTGGRSFTGRALFYYQKPNQFRLEIMGPLGTFGAVMVARDNRVDWNPPMGGMGEETVWLDLLFRVWGGDFMKGFDDPTVVVRQEGSSVVYSSPSGELWVDVKGTSMTRAVFKESETTVQMDFRRPLRVDGWVVPGGVTGESEDGGFLFDLRFSALKANRVLSEDLFQ